MVTMTGPGKDDIVDQPIEGRGSLFDLAGTDSTFFMNPPPSLFDTDTCLVELFRGDVFANTAAVSAAKVFGHFDVIDNGSGCDERERPTFLIQKESMNTSPAPTASLIATVEDTAGSTQITVNDPDPDQQHTFVITVAPTNGVASVNANGRVTYTPDTGFIGSDRLEIDVTDNGDPPLSGTVAIDITVSERQPSSGVFVGTWIGTWESAGIPDLPLTGTGGTGNITLRIESETPPFLGATSFDVVGTISMTGPGKEVFVDLPIDGRPRLFNVLGGTGSFLFGPSPENSLPGEAPSFCRVLFAGDVFPDDAGVTAVRTVGVFQISGGCETAARDSGTYELFREP